MSINDIKNQIEPISLLGCDITPHPLAMTNALSTSKWLMSIQSKINEFINDSNNLLKMSTDYTDSTYADIKTRYEQLMSSVADGSFLLDGSIDIEKLSPEFYLQLQNTIMDYLRDTTRFVTFGLSDDGYFMVYIPDSWDNINFSTDIDGHLCLELLDKGVI